MSQWKSIFNGKVGDHYHFTGKFRGMAHNKCNLKSRIPKEIPIYFHNLSAHIPVSELSKILKFVDSYRLLPASLDEL